jgi:mevalonate kinase
MDFDAARSRLQTGDTVILSCPQKVCLSGDYGDMQPGGLTFTASLRNRPVLQLRTVASGSSEIVLRGAPLDSIEEWQLIARFWERLAPLGGSYHVNVVPTGLLNVGLGSSGAASVLFAAALAIVDGSSPLAAELIRAAHTFETEIAEYPCGPQDHAASVLGGLNLIEFPSITVHSVPDLSAWTALSFWTTDERRQAHELIPAMAARHTEAIWATKATLTRRIATAFAGCDIDTVVDCIHRESLVQTELGMLTARQLKAVAAIEADGGAGKVSGAGGGGVLIVAAVDAEVHSRIGEKMLGQNLRELRLWVDDRGLYLDGP